MTMTVIRVVQPMNWRGHVGLMIGPQIPEICTYRAQVRTPTLTRDTFDIVFPFSIEWEVYCG